MLHLEITEVVLVHCNIVNAYYQRDSRVLCHIKSVCQLLGISIKNFMFLKTFNPEFSYIDLWFTDPNFKPPGIEVKINITVVTN